MKKKPIMRSRSTQTNEEESLDLSSQNPPLANREVSTRPYNLTCFNRGCHCTCHGIQGAYIRGRLRSFMPPHSSQLPRVLLKNLDGNNTEMPDSYSYEGGSKDAVRYSNTTQRHIISGGSLSPCIGGISFSEYRYRKDQSKKHKRDKNDCTPINTTVPDNKLNESSNLTSRRLELRLSEDDHGEDQSRDANNERTFINTIVPESKFDENVADIPEGYAYGGYGYVKEPEKNNENIYEDNTNDNKETNKTLDTIENLNKESSVLPKSGDETSVSVRKLDDKTDNSKGGEETNRISDTRANLNEPSNLPKSAYKTSVSACKFDDETIPHGDISSNSSKSNILKQLKILNRMSAPEVEKNRKESKEQYQHLKYSSKPYINKLIISMINEKLDSPNNDSDKERESSKIISDTEESRNNNSREDEFLNSNISKHTQAFLKYISTASKTRAVLCKGIIKQTEKEKEIFNLELIEFRKLNFEKICVFKTRPLPEYEDAVTSVIISFLSERLIFLKILVEPLAWLKNYYLEASVGLTEFFDTGSKLKCRRLYRIFEDWQAALIYFNWYLDQIIARFEEFKFVMKAEVTEYLILLAKLINRSQELIDKARRIKDFKDLKFKECDYNFLFKVMQFPKYTELAMEILRKEKSMFEDFFQKQGWEYE